VIFPDRIERWRSLVLKHWPTALFIEEDGSGKTYGEKGEWTAVIGPDMQADSVAVLTEEFYWSDIDGEIIEFPLENLD
jgi:hypothetical protein